MERIRETFSRLRAHGEKARIPFIMGGDPTVSLTSELLLTMQDAGCDLIEVGIPFSDPLADGPVIQASSMRALSRGATPQRVLSAVARVRAKLSIPVVCLSYWNPLWQFGKGTRRHGVPAFVRAARASGFSGVIVPDLSVEEAGELRTAASGQDFATVFLAAPTSPAQRLRAIARASEGFLYYVSVTGTTGPRRKLPSTLVSGIRQLRLLTTKPVCVGFGISTPAQAASVAEIADGVIIGSALIQAMVRVSGRRSALRSVATFLRRMRREV